MEPEHRPRRRNGRGRRAAPARPFWPNSAKSRRSGGRASSTNKALLPWSGGGPLMSEWPRSSLLLRLWREEIGWGEARHLVRSKSNQQGAVEMLVNGHLAAGQRVAPARLLNL